MADIGYGAKIYVDDGVSGAMAAFTDVTQITVPMQEDSSVEITHLQSSGRYREYVPGLIEPGECSFTQRYDKTAYDRVFGLKGANHTFQIEFPDGAEAEFDGFITKVECDISGADAVVDIKVSIKVTGAVDFDDSPSP